jgi:ABC-type multidrug transport system ATPase subunit
LTAGSDNPAIEARGLSKKFGDRTAVRTMDLNIARGESVVLFGPNGSGKTTLIRMLSSTLRPTTGSFKIAGLDPRRSDRETRRRIGALFHQTFLYDELSARDNLLFFARLYGVDGPRQRVETLLSAMALSGRADDAVGGFSRGMQQRLALARCLVHDPEVVFLDEPFTGLDPHSAATFMEALGELRRRDRTLLLVTHNLRRGLELCDRWIIVHRGRIVDHGVSAGLGVNELEERYLDLVTARPSGRSSP